MVKDSAPSDFFQYSLVGWCSPDLVWWKHEEHQNRFWWRFPHGFRCSLQTPGIVRGMKWDNPAVELLQWDLRRLLASPSASDYRSSWKGAVILALNSTNVNEVRDLWHGYRWNRLTPSMVRCWLLRLWSTCHGCHGWSSYGFKNCGCNSNMRIF